LISNRHGYDKNHFTEDEIHDLIRDDRLLRDQLAAERKRSFIIVVICSTILFCGLAVGCVIAGFEATKETYVQDDNVMRNILTGEPTQCASADSAVSSNSVLISRNGANALITGKPFLYHNLTSNYSTMFGSCGVVDCDDAVTEYNDRGYFQIASQACNVSNSQLLLVKTSGHTTVTSQVDSESGSFSEASSLPRMRHTHHMVLKLVNLQRPTV
jgi:hypothetical protein